MRTLFSGGLIFDGKNPPITGSDVFVENGRIKAVKPAIEFAGFAGKKINIEGMTIMPGLIDAHVHLSMGGEQHDAVAIFMQSSIAELTMSTLENAQATLRGGITSARDCGDREYNTVAVRNVIDAGRHLGPTLLCTGRTICMVGGHGSRTNGIEVSGPDETIKAVRDNIKAGVDIIKLTATADCSDMTADLTLAELTADEIRAGVNAAKALGKRSACHAQGTIGIFNAVSAGVTSIEHGFTMPDDLMSEMIRKGIYLVPTFSRLTSLLENSDTPHQLAERIRIFSESHRKAILRFHKEGGRLAMGTDMGLPLLTHGENAQELKHMVDIGITELDALCIATSKSADLLELHDRGYIRDGYWADLLIVRGNPFKDIEAVANCNNHAYVFKNGFNVMENIGPPRSGAAYPRYKHTYLSAM